MKQNKIIAITGGIGSGKSTVSEILRCKGYYVFSCDEIYAELVEDKNFVLRLCEEFGDVSNKDGSLCRNKLSEIVFKDKSALKKLNALTHPEIYRQLFLRAARCDGVCFCEVPLLFEDNAQDKFDKVVLVVREDEKRISSVCARDKVSSERVKMVIKNQFNYKNLDFAKYYVIHNNSDFTNLEIQIDSILNDIIP